MNLNLKSMAYACDFVVLTDRHMARSNYIIIIRKEGRKEPREGCGCEV